MNNYVRNRNNQTSSTRRDENDERGRKLELITQITENVNHARVILQDTELFPGLTEDGGILQFTREDVDVLRRESERIRVNQKNTNLGLAFGSSLGVYSGGVAMAGFMASVGTVITTTGRVAAVVSGVSSIAVAISRSRSESYTRRQIQSIVERLNRLPDIIYAMLTVSNLAPGELSIENALEDRQTNLTVENLLEIRRKTNELVKVLSGMQIVDENKDLDSTLEVLGKALLLLNKVKTTIDPNIFATVSTVIATTSWLLTHYRGVCQNYRNALQTIGKFMNASPAIINLLGKSGMLSENWKNLVKIVSSSQGMRVAEKVAEEVLEKAGIKVSSKAGAEVAEKITEKVIEQAGTNVTGPAGTVVVGKVGGEVLEQATTKVAGKVGGEALEQISTKVAGKVGGEVLEQASTKVAGKVSGEALEQISTKVAGKVGGEVLEQATTKVAGKVSGEALDQMSTRVAGTVGGKVLEQASTKSAGKVGGEVLEQAGANVAGKVGGEVLEQGGNTVAQKIGGEVAEQAANSSNVSGIVGSAAKVKHIRILCASVVITGIVIEGVNLKSALQNLYNGSPTDLSDFLSSLADVLEPLV